MTTEDALATLRLRLARAIVHAVDLRADLEALVGDLAAVLPALAEDGPGSLRAAVAGLFGVDEALPGELRRLVDQLADVLGLLSANEHPEEWLRRQLTSL